MNEPLNCCDYIRINFFKIYNSFIRIFWYDKITLSMMRAHETAKNIAINKDIDIILASLEYLEK